MSDYPSYNQILAGSQVRESLPAEHMTSVNGTPLAVVKGNRRRRRFPLLHMLTDTEYQAIVTLYGTVQTVGNQPQSFTFTSLFDSPATEYNVYFAQAPRRRKIGADLYEVNVELVEADS